MFLTTCISLWLAAATATEHVFTYVKPWNPFRRALTECEMCDRGECIMTDEPRCEYYADATKLIDADEVDDKEADHQHVNGDYDKIDSMMFKLVNSASSAPHFKTCIPFVSQYTDCTEENICTGCKFCSCNEEGNWVCTVKQKCRPEPKLNVDHRIVGIVIENLKRKEKNQKGRSKRSVITNEIPKRRNRKLSYTDLSRWMYGEELNNFEKNNDETEDNLESLKFNKTIFEENSSKDQVTSTVTIDSVATTETSVQKNLDLLEFNDILLGWTEKSLAFNNIIPNMVKHNNQVTHEHDAEYSEYDPLRIIKRDTSKLKTKENPTAQANTTSTNITYELVFTDAIEGLNKITFEKKKELDDLLKIQSNLISLAKTHNIDINTNSTLDHDNYNKHHIAIYKVDSFDKCVAKVKHEIRNALAEVIKTEPASNSTDLQRDLKLFFSTFRKYMANENLDAKLSILTSQENDQEARLYNNPDNKHQYLNPTKLMVNILVEINKAPGNPLRSRSKHVQKILKRVIKQLYFDDFAVINYIVHETFYDFNNYMENIGTRWNKMMQDLEESEVLHTLYRLKLLHMTLKSDISKMEDMLSLLDFARNRRMTVANGGTIDKSLLRIKQNLKMIDSSVQKIMKIENAKRKRQTSALRQSKPTKRSSIIQKLKKIFQSSKHDIKEMLRKRFPKSEIMKRIAKKKIDEIETRRMLGYQESMKEWQESLNEVPGREKRSAWSFKDRMKGIIPGYLKGKVKPAMDKKKVNKTLTTKAYDRKKKSHTKPTTNKTTSMTKKTVES